MSLLNNLPHVCTIKRRVRVKEAGGLGTAVDTLETVRTGVLCWEQQASASEITLYQKRSISVSKKIFFAEDPQVDENHVILITNRYGVQIAADSQVVLDVKSSANPDASATMGVVWRVMCDFVTGAP